MSETTENGTKRYKLKEVCIRLAEGHPLYSDVPLSSPTAALDVMRKALSQYDREVLCVVNLNNKLKPINFNIVSMGSINGSIASIPNILKSGILSNAYGFLLLHNHPWRCDAFKRGHPDHQALYRGRKDHGYPMPGSCDRRRRQQRLLQLPGVRNGGFHQRKDLHDSRADPACQ